MPAERIQYILYCRREKKVNAGPGRGGGENVAPTML